MALFSDRCCWGRSGSTRWRALVLCVRESITSQVNVDSGPGCYPTDRYHPRASEKHGRAAVSVWVNPISTTQYNSIVNIGGDFRTFSAWLRSHFLKTAIQWLNFLPSFLFSFFSDKMSDLAKAILELSILLPQTPELLGGGGRGRSHVLSCPALNFIFSKQDSQFFPLFLPHFFTFLLPAFPPRPLSPLSLPLPRGFPGAWDSRPTLQ